MIKLLELWNRRWEMTHDQAVRYWCSRHAPLVLDTVGEHIRGYCTNVGLASNYSGWSDDEAPPHDGIAEFWLDMTAEELKRRIGEAAPILWPDEQAFIGCYRPMLVREVVQKDVTAAAMPSHATALKLFVLWQRRWDMSHDEAVSYWVSRHVPLVKETLGDRILKYVTNEGLAWDYSGWSPTEAPPYDGAAEFWLDLSPEELRQVIAASRHVLWPDERAFIGTYRVMEVEERRQR
jgi:hypothetical protein